MQKTEHSLSYQDNSFYFIQPSYNKLLTQINNYIIVRNIQTETAYICKCLTSNYQNYISIGNSIEVPYYSIEKIKSKRVYNDQIIEIYEILAQSSTIESITIYQQTKVKATTTDNILNLLSSIPIISDAIIRFKFQTFQIQQLNDSIYKIDEKSSISIQTREIQQFNSQCRDYLDEFIQDMHNCYLSHLDPLQKLSQYMLSPHGGATIYGDNAKQQLFQFVYKNKRCHEYQLINDETQEKYINNMSSLLNNNTMGKANQHGQLQICQDVISNQRFLEFYSEQNCTDQQFQLLYNCIIDCMVFKQTFIERSEAQSEEARLTSKIILHLDSNEHKFYQPKIKYSIIQIIDNPSGQEQALRRQGRFGIDIQIDRVQINIRKRLIASVVFVIIFKELQNAQKVHYKILDLSEYIQFINRVIDHALLQKLQHCIQTNDTQISDQIENQQQETNYSLCFEKIVQKLNQYDYDDIVIILQKTQLQIKKQFKMDILNNYIQNTKNVQQIQDIILFIQSLDTEIISDLLQVMYDAISMVVMKYPKQRARLQLTQLEPGNTILFEDYLQELHKMALLNDNVEDMTISKLSKKQIISMTSQLQKRNILFNCSEQLKQILTNFQLSQLPLEFEQLNIQPQHIILYGTDPGCGKSALCKHIPGLFPQYKVLLIQSTDIFSQYVGESERNVSKIFASARQIRPCILVFENLDVVIGKKRGGIGLTPSSDQGDEDSSGVSQKVLTTFLTELDGVSHNNDQLFCIGICGCDISMLDSAIVRYKRFGLHIKFQNMTHLEINNILKQLNVTDTDLDKDAQMSPFAFSQYLVRRLQDLE